MNKEIVKELKENRKSDFNCVTLEGRITQQPKVRSTPDGLPVAHVTIANNLYYKNGKKVSSFPPCIFWGVDNANKIAQLNVGDLIKVEGRLVTDDYIPQGSDKPTNGRFKIDDCKLMIVRRKKINAIED